MPSRGGLSWPGSFGLRHTIVLRTGTQQELGPAGSGIRPVGALADPVAGRLRWAVHSSSGMHRPRPEGAGTSPARTPAGPATEVCSAESACYDGPAPDPVREGTMPRLSMAPHETKQRDPEDRIRRRLPAEEVRHRHVHLRPLHVGRDPVSRVGLLRGADQRHRRRATTTRRRCGSRSRSRRSTPTCGRPTSSISPTPTSSASSTSTASSAGRPGSHIVRLIARPADADRHDAAHGAPRPERRAAPRARPGRRPVGPAGRDVRARPHVPPRRSTTSRRPRST